MVMINMGMGANEALGDINYYGTTALFNQPENGEHTYIYEQPGVRMRPLPFFDLIEDLIRPAGLNSSGIIGRPNESTINFKLSIEQADLLASSLNTKQVLVRFGHLDDSCEQDDNFPPDISLSVNNCLITLPPAVSNPNKPNVPAKRTGQQVDITKYCKLCPFIHNTISIKWFADPTDPKKSYVVSVLIAEQKPADILLERIRQRGESDPLLTKQLISGTDNEVATMNLQTSLCCPLGKMRMSSPCKATTCQHIPCFDALAYLQMNERKPNWTCPICYKPAYFHDLMIDGYFMDILRNTSATVTEVTLELDGRWNPVMKSETAASSNTVQPEIITISDDDD